jgi:hypothetical protein
MSRLGTCLTLVGFGLILCGRLALADEPNGRDRLDPGTTARRAIEAAEAQRIRKELHLGSSKRFIIECLGRDGFLNGRRRDTAVLLDESGGAIALLPGWCR